MPFGLEFRFPMPRGMPRVLAFHFFAARGLQWNVKFDFLETHMATFDDLLEQGNDILAADAIVAANANYKLSAWMRGQVSAAISLAGVQQDAQGLAEGTRRAASSQVKTAYLDAQKLIREFNRFINNYNDNNDQKIDTAAARADYGLGRILTDDLTQPFVKSTLERIARVAAGTPAPVVVPRASVLARIAEITSVIGTQGVSAGVGNRAEVTGEKDAAQAALEMAVSRVRFFLWSTLPGMFRDPLLHNYGFVPRQESETEREKPPTAS